MKQCSFDHTPHWTDLDGPTTSRHVPSDDQRAHLFDRRQGMCDSLAKELILLYASTIGSGLRAALARGEH
jgi:hypothetical protein